MSRKRPREDPDFGDDMDIDLDDIDMDDIELDEETIAKMVARAVLIVQVDAAPEMEELTTTAMKRMLISFERAYTKNQQLRVKYAGSPERFVESEVELDEEIKKLQILATAPELYPEMLKLKAHESILSLLTHENTDIAIDALDLIRELTDADEDTQHVDESHHVVLVDAMLEYQVLELLIQNIKRFNDTAEDEKKGILNILHIIENMIEIKEGISDMLAQKTDILTWLLRRLRTKTFDDIKQYSSEILTILVQSSETIPVRVAKANGVEILLMAVSKYKKTNPPSMDEEEYLENLFDCLCVICVLQENKKYFTQAEGLKLLQIIIKNKKYARKAAIKLLDYVLQNDMKNCRRWVNLPGLGTLFAAFMKKGSQKHKRGFDDEHDDEHLISIIATLLQELEDNEPELWARVVNKFRENDFEKVERLLELHEKYNLKLRKINHAIELKQDALKRGFSITEDKVVEYFQMQRLDGGLFTLQFVDFVIAVISQAHVSTKRKVEELLNQQDGTLDEVSETLRNYANFLGTEHGEEKATSLNSKLTQLADAFEKPVPPH